MANDNHSIFCKGYRGVGNEFDESSCDCKQRAQHDEPAWLTRLANGNGSMSSFVAKEIAHEVRELMLYKRAMESMAKQFICPKMTAMELAKIQLQAKPKKQEQ